VEERFTVPQAVVERLNKSKAYSRLTAGRVWHSVETLSSGPAPSGSVGEALSEIAESRRSRDELSSQQSTDRDKRLFRSLKDRELGKITEDAVEDAYVQATRRQLEGESKAALAEIATQTTEVAAQRRNSVVKGWARIRATTQTLSTVTDLRDSAAGAVSREFRDGLEASVQADPVAVSETVQALNSLGNSKQFAVSAKYLDPLARSRVAEPAYQGELEPKSNFLGLTAYRPGKPSRRQNPRAIRKRLERVQRKKVAARFTQDQVLEAGEEVPLRPRSTIRLPPGLSLPPRLQAVLDQHHSSWNLRSGEGSKAGSDDDDGLYSSEEEEVERVEATRSVMQAATKQQQRQTMTKKARTRRNPRVRDSTTSSPSRRADVDLAATASVAGTTGGMRSVDGNALALHVLKSALDHGTTTEDVFGYGVRPTSARKRVERSILLGFAQTAAKIEVDRLTGMRSGVAREAEEALKQGDLTVALPSLAGAQVFRGGGLPLKYFGFSGKADTSGVKAVKAATRKGLRGFGGATNVEEHGGEDAASSESEDGDGGGGVQKAEDGETDAVAHATTVEGRAYAAARAQRLRWYRMRGDSVFGMLVSPWTVPPRLWRQCGSLGTIVEQLREGVKDASKLVEDVEVRVVRVPSGRTIERLDAAAAIGAVDEHSSDEEADDNGGSRADAPSKLPQAPSDLVVERLGAPERSSRRARVAVRSDTSPLREKNIDVELYRAARPPLASIMRAAEDAGGLVLEFREAMNGRRIRMLRRLPPQSPGEEHEAGSDAWTAEALAEPLEASFARWGEEQEDFPLLVGPKTTTRMTRDVIEAVGRWVRVRLVGLEGLALAVKLQGPPLPAHLATVVSTCLRWKASKGTLTLTSDNPETTTSERSLAEEASNAAAVGRLPPDPDVAADEANTLQKGQRLPWGYSGNLFRVYVRCSPASAAALNAIPLQARVAVAVALVGVVEHSIAQAIVSARHSIATRRQAERDTGQLHESANKAHNALRSPDEHLEATATLKGLTQHASAAAASRDSQKVQLLTRQSQLSAEERTRAQGLLRATVARLTSVTAVNSLAQLLCHHAGSCRAAEVDAAGLVAAVLSDQVGGGQIDKVTEVSPYEGSLDADSHRIAIVTTPANWARRRSTPKARSRATPLRKASLSTSLSATALSPAQRPVTGVTEPVVRDPEANRRLWLRREQLRAERARPSKIRGPASKDVALSDRAKRKRLERALRKFAAEYDPTSHAASLARDMDASQRGETTRFEKGELSKSTTELGDPLEDVRRELAALGPKEATAAAVEVGLGLPPGWLPSEAIERLKTTMKLYADDVPLAHDPELWSSVQELKRSNSKGLLIASESPKPPPPASNTSTWVGSRLLQDLSEVREAASTESPLSLRHEDALSLALQRARMRSMPRSKERRSSEHEDDKESTEKLDSSALLRRLSATGETAGTLSEMDSRMAAVAQVLSIPVQALARVQTSSPRGPVAESLRASYKSLEPIPSESAIRSQWRHNVAMWEVLSKCVEALSLTFSSRTTVKRFADSLRTQSRRELLLRDEAARRSINVPSTLQLLASSVRAADNALQHPHESPLRRKLSGTMSLAPVQSTVGLPLVHDPAQWDIQAGRPDTAASSSRASNSALSRNPSRGAMPSIRPVMPQGMLLSSESARSSPEQGRSVLDLSSSFDARASTPAGVRRGTRALVDDLIASGALQSLHDAIAGEDIADDVRTMGHEAGASSVAVVPLHKWQEEFSMPEPAPSRLEVASSFRSSSREAQRGRPSSRSNPSAPRQLVPEEMLLKLRDTGVLAELPVPDVLRRRNRDGAGGDASSTSTSTASWIQLHHWLDDVHQAVFERTRTALEQVTAMVGPKLAHDIEYQGVKLSHWLELAKPDD
jgi:hypothetical protein